MNVTLASRTVRYVSLAVVLVAVGTPAPADVITAGDVDPSGAAVQSDPWAAGDKLYVGQSGPGTLTVQAAGLVTTARGYLGYEFESSGIVTVTGAGSLWNNSERLYVGQSGCGSLGVEADGRVTTMHGYLGYDSVGTGEATVTGTGSQWDNSGRLRVGVSGSGTLDVKVGGLVTNTEGYIGYFPDSTGEVNVGTEGRWDNSVDLFIGGDNSGAGGAGTLNVVDSGLVTVLGTTKLWSTGTLNLDGDGSFRDHVDGGLFRSVTYTSTAVRLQNLLAIEGDTDGDRDVDTVDLTGMIINYTGAIGSGTTWLTGDTDGDGDTDTVDLTTAIINFTGARNTAVAVPEPSALLLLVLAIGCLAAARARSCRR